jgi:hypothetical protein|tara:strand:+ start:4071 stop:4211 length:141 start_codon:yes stop_codon:yes gene_type:complete
MRAIQQTDTTAANSHLTFGYFAKAIVNFHQHLQITVKEKTKSWQDS